MHVEKVAYWGDLRLEKSSWREYLPDLLEAFGVSKRETFKVGLCKISVKS